MDYTALREAKEAEARTLEQQYNGRIAQPMRMSISMPATAADQSDNDLDFTIRIAPNDTVVEGSTTAEVPETQITHGIDGNRAGWVRADPISSRGGGGSQPSAMIPGWAHVRMIDPEARYWVKMHLLNENLHGPGVAWNLTPGDKATNSAHLHGAESHAKTRVLDHGEVLWYETRITYYSGPIIQDFPSRFETKWGKYGETAQLPGSPWAMNVDPPPTTISQANLVDLKTAGRSQLMAIGISRGLAGNIEQVRLTGGGFRDQNDFVVKMTAHYANLRGGSFAPHWATIERLLGVSARF